jgi:hypothetical protein
MHGNCVRFSNGNATLETIATVLEILDNIHYFSIQKRAWTSYLQIDC